MHGVLLGQGLGLASHLGTTPSLFSSQGANGGSERRILCPKETPEKTETQRRRGEFPSSHRMLFTLKDSRQAEGVGDRGWGCRRGSPAVSKSPKGPGRASCGCVWGGPPQLCGSVGQNSSKGSGQFSYEQSLPLRAASELLTSMALSDHCSQKAHPSGSRGHEGPLGRGTGRTSLLGWLYSWGATLRPVVSAG